MSVPLTRDPGSNSKRPVYDMELPFNPNTLKQHAQSNGLRRQEAGVFAHLALQKLRALQEKDKNGHVTTEQIAEEMKRHAMEETARLAEERRRTAERGYSIVEEMELESMKFTEAFGDDESGPMVELEDDEVNGMASKKFKFSEEGAGEFFEGCDPYHKLEQEMETLTLSMKYGSRDILTAICQHVELAVELAKHLRPEDILTLYSTNRAFHNSISSHLLSSVKMCIAYRCPEAGRVFPFKIYRSLLVSDPGGRKWGFQLRGKGQEKVMSQWFRGQTRSIPGFKYLQLVLGRDRYCWDIIGIMARNGHRLPPTMHKTLLRLWLLNDLATTFQRQALLRNKDIWTDEHLYNAQLFFVKLSLLFNDPVYGPCTWELVHLILGQKGLYPLWQLLMRTNYTTLSQLVELKARYDFELPPDHWGADYFDSEIHGVPFNEVGIGHFEGWGAGDVHLSRPDELVPVEAVTRGLELDKHLMQMMTYGHFDWATGENLVPAEDELYISDDERVLSRTDTSHHWQRKHALKKRFFDLDPVKQQQIIEDEEDDRLRAMAWCGEDIDDHDSADDKDYGNDEFRVANLEDEIDRGYLVRPRPRDASSQVPADDDKKGWTDFVTRALMGVPPELDEDEALKAQAWQTYNDEDYGAGDWDWDGWMKEQEERKKNEASAAACVGATTCERDQMYDEDADDEDDEDDGDDEDE